MTLNDMLVSIIGEYVPLAESGLASINWPWLAAAGALLLTLWSIFRMIGVILSAK